MVPVGLTGLCSQLHVSMGDCNAGGSNHAYSAAEMATHGKQVEQGEIYIQQASCFVSCPSGFVGLQMGLSEAPASGVPE